MEIYTLIKRKKSIGMIFLAWFFVALGIISLLFLCMGVALAFLFAAAFFAIAYFLISGQNREFEYNYFDGELRFAKIRNKSRRKSLGTYDMDAVVTIAPAGDRSVYNYENDKSAKILDYTSRSGAPYYDIVIKNSNQTILIKAELDDEYLSAIEKKYKMKVKRREE